MGNISFETKKYAKGDIILAKEAPADRLIVLMNGKVVARTGNINIALTVGALIGMFDMTTGAGLLDYMAVDDTTVCILSGKESQDIRQFFQMGKQYRMSVLSGSMKENDQLMRVFSMERALTEQACKYIKMQYLHYLELCKQVGCTPLNSMKLFNADSFVWELGKDKELFDYLTEFSKLSPAVQQAYFNMGDMAVIRYIKDASRLAQPLLRGCEMQLMALQERMALLCGNNQENIFSIYMELLKNSKTPKSINAELLKIMSDTVDLHEKIEQTLISKLHLSINQTSSNYRSLYDNIAGFYQTSTQSSIMESVSQAVKSNAFEQTDGLLDKLLEYSELEEEFCEEFRQLIQQYKDMDKNSTENDARALRKKLADHFYELYTAVFLKAEGNELDGPGLRLFINYGIVDDTMFAPEVLQALAAHEIHTEDEELPIAVYTPREWLHEIYIGNKEPSRNEFDQDYEEHLRELQKGRLPFSKDELEELNSGAEKSKYEIKNFITSNNRLTSGHLSTFCPVLDSELLNDNYQSQLITAVKVNEAFKQVLDIDFSVFYRDVMYDDRDNGITNMQIHQQVLPDVICMPNAGTLGRMWQEISGKKRATPGRFVFPIIMGDDVNKHVLHMIGQFRWEICKRVQGAYWNDVSEPSLTSEFCDYIQFYKKNRDLSDKAKEKIAQMLVKCRNNYGNVFATQYVTWVQNESGGSVRLDKVARNIMGRYCPFTIDIRTKLIEQPMFTEAINRYEKERKKKQKELNNRRAGIRNSGKTETEEFVREIEYYEL